MRPRGLEAASEVVLVLVVVGAGAEEGGDWGESSQLINSSYAMVGHQAFKYG